LFIDHVERLVAVGGSKLVTFFYLFILSFVTNIYLMFLAFLWEDIHLVQYH